MRLANSLAVCLLIAGTNPCHGIERRDLSAMPEAESIVADLEKRARTNYVSPTALFYAAIGLANHDRTFFWLDQAIEEKVFLVIILLRTSPIVNHIRNDPRFEEALDRVGLLRDV